MSGRLGSPLVVLAFAAACTVGGAPPAPPEPRECRLAFEAPEGFTDLESFREEYADHVGTRAGFVDDRGRELHAFAGIPGEFGEGLPDAGEVALPSGGTGAMAGDDRIWVVQWSEGGPCDPRAVLGNGLSRRRFLALVARGLDAGG